MLFGPEVVSKLTVPLITANSYIKLLEVIERLDALFMFYWIGGGIFKTAIFLYTSIYIAQMIFNKDTYYIFILPALPGVYYFSFSYFQNITELRSFLKNSTLYFLIVLIIYPVLLLIISLLKGVNYNEKK